MTEKKNGVKIYLKSKKAHKAYLAQLQQKTTAITNKKIK